VDAHNAQNWTASIVIGIEPKSGQNGGAARAYFGRLTIRLSSGHRGPPRHDSERAWMFMQIIVS
jgi:hypothetical protein